MRALANLPYAISGKPECALSPYNGKNYTNNTVNTAGVQNCNSSTLLRTQTYMLICKEHIIFWYFSTANHAFSKSEMLKRPRT